jgi:MraZ protein
MAFFSGEYECVLDAKSRMVLPARIKSKLPETDLGNVVLSRGFESCLVLYSQTEFKKIYSKVAGLNEFSEEFRTFQRNFFRGINEMELDNNGRLLIPKSLSLYAQLEKDLIVVGMGNRVEIWNPTLYNEYLIKDNADFSKLAEKYLGQ